MLRDKGRGVGGGTIPGNGGREQGGGRDKVEDGRLEWAKDFGGQE